MPLRYAYTPQKQSTAMTHHGTHHPPTTHCCQVASALYSPELTKEGGGALATLYPEDVIARAKAYHAATNGSGMGAYTGLSNPSSNP